MEITNKATIKECNCKTIIKNKFEKATPILLIITYIFFIISNIIALFFNFELGIKINATVATFSDIFFVSYLIIKEKKT